MAILAGRAAALAGDYRFLPIFIGALQESVMYLLILGLVVLVLKYFGVGFMAELSWWWVAAPFALTVLWWYWADATGYTKRKEMEKMDRRRHSRIDRHRKAMGIQTKRR
jgi:small Trp-rich protein